VASQSRYGTDPRIARPPATQIGVAIQAAILLAAASSLRAPKDGASTLRMKPKNHQTPTPKATDRTAPTSEVTGARNQPPPIFIPKTTCGAT